ncbi:SurA N-terminal domain-containing protein [Azospirillum sp. SYSU D00513]|uniref:SurA N-terminal domain-containing protein n=1 Tax=Azospirillum sp. SYSU D00513 TaxID=2812561 RepID=UPI001A95B64F|nr:SurA N-terminal domain-containing protein [Azospirillum sp. SYSU D00513]
MLQLIRGFAGSWVTKILFVLLILSFGAWGIGDMTTAGTSSTVAKVGDKPVDRAELDLEFRRQVERLRPMVGGSLTLEQARQFGLLDQSLSTLVQRALYDQVARDLGIVVSDEVIRQRIADEPAFRNPQGQFDPEQFRTVLRNNQLTEDAYVSIMRREIARELAVAGVLSGVSAPKPLTEALYRHRAEKRVAEVITLPNAVVGDVGTPDDAAVQKYYDDHQVRFTAPEYRALTVARLSPEEVAKDIPVSDEELRAAYTEREDEFGTPERRSIQMVLADDEALARRIAEAAKTKGLAEAAKEAGVEPIALDNVARNELPELGDAAFALDSGAVSEPIKTALGWHVLGVTEVQPGSSKSFEEVRDELLATLKREKAVDSVYSIANGADDQLASGAPLEEVAQSKGLTLVKIPAVDNSGQTPEGKAAEGVPNLAEILPAAFQQASGTTSNLTEGTGNAFYAVRVDGITPAAPKPLDQVRAEVVAAWQGEERAKRAAAKAEELANRLKQEPGAAIETVAAEAGGVLSVTAPFTRDARAVETLPGDLVRRLFAAKPGEVVTGSGPQVQTVARLKEVIPADPAAPGAEIAPVEATVSQGLEGDIVAQLGAALQQDYPVEVYRDRIDQFFATPN